MKKLSASALPTVMVICVLICILVLFAFTLFDMNSLFYANYHLMKQRKEDLQSAFILYCNDSTLLNSVGQDNEFQLYEDIPTSLVRYQVHPWGLYEYVTISTIDNKFHTTRLVGKEQDCKYEASLWVSSRDMALSFSGHTEAKGKVYVPLNGLNYAQLNEIPFKGKEVEEHFVNLSTKELPVIDASHIDSFHELTKSMDISSFPSEKDRKPFYSFEGETSYFLLSETDDRPHIRGNVVLYGDEVTLTAESKLSDVILVAQKVTLEEGFAGSLQIIAQDTVIIEDHVQLLYPSGVFLKGNEGKTYLRLGDHSRLDGYAIIFGSTENNSGFYIATNYHQEITASFVGLLYVDGVADVRGELSGAVYLKECYYLPENGLYAGMMNDAKIERNTHIAYPFFFSQSNYRRKEIKTIY